MHRSSSWRPLRRPRSRLHLLRAGQKRLLPYTRTRTRLLLLRLRQKRLMPYPWAREQTSTASSARL